MFQYSAFTTLWKALVTLLVTGTGVVVGVEAMDLPADSNTFAATWPVYVVPVVLALIRALENWRKNAGGKPRFVWPWDKIVPVCLCFALVGCAGLGGTGLWRPAIGDHSQASVEFSEKLSDGSQTAIKYKASGEAASKAAVAYNGETTPEITAPWRLSVTGDASVTSPQATAIAESYGVLLEKAPETVQELAKQISAVMSVIGATEGATGAITGGIKETIIQALIDRFISGKLPL